MKPAKNLLLLLCALLLVSPAVAQDDKPISLRPAWNVGQASSYSFWSKMEKKETAQLPNGPRSQTTTYVSEGETSWTVDQVNDDGTFACTMRITKLKITITAGEAEPVVIDSENPSGESPMFDQLIGAMVQTPLKVSVNADGTVASVGGVDELTAAAGREVADAGAVPDELDFKETASDLATLMAAPAEATPGQTWSVKNTWNQDSVLPQLDATSDWDTTFTFESLGSMQGVPIATIKTQSDVDIKIDLSELPENEAEIDVQIDQGKASGEIFFDLSRHETVARNDSMSYTANVTITPPTDRIPPIRITIQQKQHSQLLRISESSSDVE
ncbi:MAG: DUF6263 family protein [Phycisphaeraceae bacterium]